MAYIICRSQGKIKMQRFFFFVNLKKFQDDNSTVSRALVGLGPFQAQGPV
jgi:hypothetical protein